MHRYSKLALQQIITIFFELSQNRVRYHNVTLYFISSKP